MDKVCARYKDWYNSEPFDQGSTVRGALGALTRHWRELDDDWSLIIRESGARDIYKVAEAVNNQSKSNGSLMKICPIAVWAAEILSVINEENTKLYHEIIIADAKIIHSEKLTQACIFVYSATIAYLINNRQDKQKAAKALEYATQLAADPLCNVTADSGAASATIWIDSAKKLWDECKTNGNGWIYDPKTMKNDEERYRCTEAIGFLKHAFILSYFYLNKAADNGWTLNEGEGQCLETFYADATREVISLGGDTDTNACIVGGMIGAIIGVNNITEQLLANYFEYDNDEKNFKQGYGRKRPEWLNMGRNTIDSCFWLHILRYRNKEGQDKAKIEQKYDPPKKIPDHVPIQN